MSSRAPNMADPPIRSRAVRFSTVERPAGSGYAGSGEASTSGFATAMEQNQALLYEDLLPGLNQLATDLDASNSAMEMSLSIDETRLLFEERDAEAPKPRNPALSQPLVSDAKLREKEKQFERRAIELEKRMEEKRKSKVAASITHEIRNAANAYDRSADAFRERRGARIKETTHPKLEDVHYTLNSISVPLHLISKADVGDGDTEARDSTIPSGPSEAESKSSAPRDTVDRGTSPGVRRVARREDQNSVGESNVATSNVGRAFKTLDLLRLPPQAAGEHAERKGSAELKAMREIMRVTRTKTRHENRVIRDRIRDVEREVSDNVMRSLVDRTAIRPKRQSLTPVVGNQETKWLPSDVGGLSSNKYAAYHGKLEEGRLLSQRKQPATWDGTDFKMTLLRGLHVKLQLRLSVNSWKCACSVARELSALISALQRKRNTELLHSGFNRLTQVLLNSKARHDLAREYHVWCMKRKTIAKWQSAAIDESQMSTMKALAKTKRESFILRAAFAHLKLLGLLEKRKRVNKRIVWLRSCLTLVSKAFALWKAACGEGAGHVPEASNIKYVIDRAIQQLKEVRSVFSAMEEHIRKSLYFVHKKKDKRTLFKEALEHRKIHTDKPEASKRRNTKVGRRRIKPTSQSNPMSMMWDGSSESKVSLADFISEDNVKPVLSFDAARNVGVDARAVHAEEVPSRFPESSVQKERPGRLKSTSTSPMQFIAKEKNVQAEDTKATHTSSTSPMRGQQTSQGVQAEDTKAMHTSSTSPMRDGSVEESIQAGPSTVTTSAATSPLMSRTSEQSVQAGSWKPFVARSTSPMQGQFSSQGTQAGPLKAMQTSGTLTSSTIVVDAGVQMESIEPRVLSSELVISGSESASQTRQSQPQDESPAPMTTKSASTSPIRYDKLPRAIPGGEASFPIMGAMEEFRLRRYERILRTCFEGFRTNIIQSQVLDDVTLDFFIRHLVSSRFNGWRMLSTLKNQAANDTRCTRLLTRALSQWNKHTSYRKTLSLLYEVFQVNRERRILQESFDLIRMNAMESITQRETLERLDSIRKSRRAQIALTVWRRWASMKATQSLLIKNFRRNAAMRIFKSCFAMWRRTLRNNRVLRNAIAESAVLLSDRGQIERRIEQTFELLLKSLYAWKHGVAEERVSRKERAGVKIAAVLHGRNLLRRALIGWKGSLNSVASRMPKRNLTQRHFLLWSLYVKSSASQEDRMARIKLRNASGCQSEFTFRRQRVLSSHFQRLRRGLSVSTSAADGKRQRSLQMDAVGAWIDVTYIKPIDTCRAVLRGWTAYAQARAQARRRRVESARIALKSAFGVWRGQESHVDGATEAEERKGRNLPSVLQKDDTTGALTEAGFAGTLWGVANPPPVGKSPFLIRLQMQKYLRVDHYNYVTVEVVRQLEELRSQWQLEGHLTRCLQLEGMIASQDCP